MSGGSSGVASVRQILIEAYAVNYRVSILNTDVTDAYDELRIIAAPEEFA
jgi:hypothetical protein